MAMFQFKCPQCGKLIDADESYSGQVAQCPYCGKGIVVPQNKVKAGTGAAIPKRLQQPQMKTASSEDDRNGRGIGKIALITTFSLICAFVLIAGLSFLGYFFWGDEPRLNRATLNYECGNYNKAFRVLKEFAQKGFPTAQLYLADCYVNGNGTTMNTEEAVKWYRAAANNDIPEAFYKMYECCKYGIGIEPNNANAAKWCRKAADAGLAKAMYDMAMLYVEGIGVEENQKSAFKWFRKGAEAGHSMSLYKFGQCYRVGYGVEEDKDEAAKWQGKAVAKWRVNANLGDEDSMIALAQMYWEGDVVELDKEESVRWYRKASESGNRPCTGNACILLF